MFTTPQTGRCCAEELCQFPHLQLRPEHTCPVCKKIVHALCGEYNGRTDKHICFKYSKQDDEVSQKTITQTVSNITKNAASYVASWVSGAAKDGKGETSETLNLESDLEETLLQAKPSFPPCKSCGGLDHRRKSSSKCPFYKKQIVTEHVEATCTIAERKTKARRKSVRKRNVKKSEYR